MFDNDLFTERQKEIIVKIGKDHKEKLDKEKRRVYGVHFSILFVLLAVVFVLVLTEIFNPGQGLIFAVILIIAAGSNISRNSKVYENLKGQDDYAVGLHFVDKDPRVVGNADNRLKATRVGTLVSGIFALVIALICLLVSLFDKPTDFSALEEVNGTVHSVRLERERILISLQDDDREYAVPGIYLKKVDWAEFEKAAKRGKSITVLANTTKEGVRYVYYLEVEGTEFLTREEVSEAENRNLRIGYALAAVFGAVALVCPKYYLIFKRTVYKKNKAKEIYNLEYAEEELEALAAAAEEMVGETEEKTYIKTGCPKSYLFILGFFGALGLAGVAGAWFINDGVLKWLVFGFALFFLLLALIGVYDCLNRREILDGDTLTVWRLFGTKNIKVKELKKVVIKPLQTESIARTGKTFCRIGNLTKGLDRILEELNKRGVRIEIFMK